MKVIKMILKVFVGIYAVISMLLLTLVIVSDKAGWIRSFKCGNGDRTTRWYGPLKFMNGH